MAKHAAKIKKQQEANVQNQVPTSAPSYDFDFSDVDELRKAIIASEIFNRKY